MMTETNWTFVSSFVNLDAYQKGNPNVRLAKDYLQQAISTLQIPVPLLLFISTDMVSIVEEKIKGRAYPTKIVPFEFESLITFQQYEKVCANRQAPEFKPMYDTSRNTPSFSITTIAKFEFMNLATILDPFKSSMFAWIDFHYGHVDKQYSLELLQKQVARITSYPIDYWSRTKYHFGLIDWIPTSHYKNKRLYYRTDSIRTTFAGGFHFGPREVIPKLAEAILKEYEETVAQGLGHAEEQVMYYVYHHCPSMFHVFPCDYYSIIFNVILPTRDIGCTLNNLLPHLLEDKQYGLVRNITSQLLQSHSNGLINLPESFFAIYCKY